MASSTPMELDSSLVAVDRSIQNVEEKLKALEDQLKKEQDPDEKKYLREEKKHLREEEEQLWEKKKQLRAKELLLLESTVASGIHTGGFDHVLDLLQSFWSTCRGRKPGDLIGYVAVEEWRELNFRHDVSVPLRKGLYVRKCFKHFLQVSLKVFQRPDTYVHVNGPPGIGKSAFLWYVVMMVGAVTGNPEAEPGLGLDYDVIVQLVLREKTTGWVAFFRDGSVGYHPQDYLGLKRRFTGEVLHLVDQKYQGNHLGYVMVFASPDEENTKGIDKTGGARVVTKILPPWRTETDGFYELMQKELQLSKEAVDEVVQKWGYVPRVLFKSRSAGTDEIELQVVIEKVALARACNYAGKKFQIESGTLPCRLFEMVPDPVSYEKFTVQFASDYLAQAYLDRLWENRRDEVVTFVKSSAGQADVASLRGYAYEYAMAHFWSDRETTISAISLGDALRPMISCYPPQLTLEVGKREIRRYLCLADIRKAKEDGVDLSKYLWLPEKHNPLVHFLIFRPNLMGQATISLLHSVLEQKLLETGAFMWEMTSYEEPTSYLILTPSVQAWSSGCLLWKNARKQERTHHDRLLSFIGRYCAEYQLPMGTVDEAAMERSAELWNFKLREPDKVKKAVESMWKSVKQSSDNAKKAAVTKKLKLVESGVSEAAARSEMKKAYYAFMTQELGVDRSDEHYEEVFTLTEHCMVRTWEDEIRTWKDELRTGDDE